ncbi:unnamed protein product [Amaranthus hypochondriacus]
MEAWLAELEKDVDPVISSLISNNPYHEYEEIEVMEASFEEQLGATLGEDFPYPFSSKSSKRNCINSTSPDQWEDFIDQFMEMPPGAMHHSSSTESLITTTSSVITSPCNKTNVQQHQQLVNKEEINKPKRKRQPSQVQGHILAERKRRELLSQMFISLSAIIPGLKKMDKTSVLGEAIKYMKQLKEKVKTLEEMAVKRNVESMVVVKKSQVIMDDESLGDDNNNDSSSIVEDTCGSGNRGDNPNNGNEEDNNDPLPEIEVKISGQTILMRIHCQNQKGILTTIFAELDKHDINITSCSVIPFDTLALDITIVAQMEMGFNNNVRSFVRSLCTSIRSAGRKHNASCQIHHST